MQYFFGNKDVNQPSANEFVHRETESPSFYICAFMGAVSMFSKLDACTPHLVSDGGNDPFRSYSSKILLQKRRLYMIHSSSWFTTGTAMREVKTKLWFNAVVPNQTLIVLPINYFALADFNIQGENTLGGNPAHCTAGTVLAPHQMERTNIRRSDY